MPQQLGVVASFERVSSGEAVVVTAEFNGFSKIGQEHDIVIFIDVDIIECLVRHFVFEAEMAFVVELY